MNYRPVILLGAGVRGNPELVEHLCSLNIPVLLTWMSADAIPEDHTAYCGRPGIFGQRAANIIQQKATHLYCFGARLDGEQVAYDYDRFASKAQIFVYDVDRTEAQKFPPRYRFSDCLDSSMIPSEPDEGWLTRCKDLYHRLHYRDFEAIVEYSLKYVDPFHFIFLLHEYSLSSDVFAIGSSGNAPTVFFQSYKVKAGQRISNVCTIGSMGADIPMALGASLANPGKRVICVTGDGGFHMNAQELEVIRRLHLPITFFVFNNNGYNSIRVAQKARFGRVTGADPSSGLTLPEIEAIAQAYRIAYKPLRGADLGTFGECFTDAPMIVEVFVDPEWQQLPRVMASTVNGQLRTDDMENMYPYLPEDELRRIMEW